MSKTTYQLTITRQEENPNYPAELKKYNSEKNQYHRSEYVEEPKKYLKQETLLVEVTEEQFEKIRKQVLECF